MKTPTIPLEPPESILFEILQDPKCRNVSQLALYEYELPWLDILRHVALHTIDPGYELPKDLGADLVDHLTYWFSEQIALDMAIDAGEALADQERGK